MLDFSANQARGHRDIIARFGRHPHRNEVLGRQSTPEELEYLATGHSSTPGRCRASTEVDHRKPDRNSSLTSFFESGRLVLIPSEHCPVELLVEQHF